MKKEGLIFLIIFCSFMLIASAQAKIVFSKGSETYNLGDKIQQKVTVTSNAVFDGFFRVNLACDGNDNLIYYSPIKLDENSAKDIDLSFEFNYTGTCNFLASLEKDNQVMDAGVSEKIIISNEIVFDLQMNKENFIPNDELKLKGKVFKKNGELFTGAVSLNVFNTTNSIAVNKGSFSFSLIIPADAMPGNTEMKLNAADDLGNVGEKIISFKVASIPTSLVIDVNNVTILPNTTLVMTPKLLDQYGNVISENVSLRLSKEGTNLLFFQQNSLLLEEFLTSGNSTGFKFDQFAEPGDYIIEVYSEGFKEEKLIQVLSVEKIDVQIIEGNVIITNIGNVPYKKPLKLDLEFGNFTKPLILDLNLNVDETKTFKLEAPQGTYNIKATLDKIVQEFKNIPLTGNLVAAIELDKNQTNPGIDNSSKSYLWVVVLVVIVIILFIFGGRFHLFKKRYKKASSQDYVSARRPVETQNVQQVTVNKPEPRQVKEPVKKMPSVIHTYSRNISEDSPLKQIFYEVSSTLDANTIVNAKLLGVQKQEVSLACIKLQGLSNLEDLQKKDTILFKKLASEFFSGISKIIRTYGGVADLHGNKLIILLLKPGQELYSVKTVNEIKAFVDKFDEKFRDKGIHIEASAGAHAGLLAFNLSNRTLKYGFDDTFRIVDALSSKAFRGEILISNSLYSKVGSLINAKKITPLHLDERRAIETLLVQNPSPSQIKDEGKSRIRQILDRM